MVKIMNHLIICISKSGNTPEIMDLVPFLKMTKNPLIAITGDTNSSLAKNSSVVLNSHVDIKKINTGILLNFKKVEKFKDGINEIPDDKIDIEVWTFKNIKFVITEKNN